MALVANGLSASPGRSPSGSSFYMAMRLLPRPEREAMFAIYGFFRAIDDIADEGDWPTRSHRRAALNRWRADLVELYAGRPPLHLADLATAVQLFRLREEDFLSAIDGVEMDVIGTMYPPDLATLDLYCDRVASAVGRLSVRIFGMPEEDGLGLAHHLGRALQLTNILRDLDEDADMGRLYLPREFLALAGIKIGRPEDVIVHSVIDDACRDVARMARRHYREADRIMRRQTGGHMRAPRLMRGVYGQLLEKMEEVGWAWPRERVRLGKAQIVWIALKGGLAG
jgi:squalene synthase HpnD